MEWYIGIEYVKNPETDYCIISMSEPKTKYFRLGSIKDKKLFLTDIAKIENDPKLFHALSMYYTADILTYIKINEYFTELEMRARIAAEPEPPGFWSEVGKIAFYTGLCLLLDLEPYQCS